MPRPARAEDLSRLGPVRAATPRPAQPAAGKPEPVKDKPNPERQRPNEVPRAGVIGAID